jgi:hypothetical protein
VKSSAIKSVSKITGKFNTRITFKDNTKAEYNLTQGQIDRLKSDHPGSYFNKNIRIKKTPF